MNTVFLAIQDYLTLKMPAIAHIDLWNNQLTNFDTENPFAFPAVFVEIMPITWTRQIKSKRGDGSIKIHYVQETYASSAKGSSDQVEALTILENAQKLEDLLEDLEGSNFAPLVGLNTETDANHDMLIDTIIEYSISITRSLDKRKLVSVTPDLKITATY